MLDPFHMLFTAHILLTNRVLAFSDDNADLEGLQGMPKATVLVSDRTRIQVQILLTSKSTFFPTG